MARGKHATSAEARRAREAAETEAASARLRVERLSAENAELKETVERMRADHVATISVLNSHIAERTSGEVQTLRREVEEAERRARDDWLACVARVSKVLKATGFSASPEFYPRLAEAMRVNVGDIFKAGMSQPSRAQRRMTNKLANLNIHLMDKSSGVI